MKKEIHPELEEVKRSEEKPLTAMFAVTYRCQCRCPHCGSGSFTKSRKSELSTDEALDTIRQIAEVGTKSISFFGGEPLIRKDLPELVKYCSDRGMGSIVESNAVLMHGKMAATLKDAGLNMVHISIDTPNPEEHDRLRGVPGLFEKAIKAIKECKALGFKTEISSYVNGRKLNNGDVDGILNIARGLGVKVRLVAPVLAGRLLEADELLNDEARAKLKSLLDPELAYWETEYCNTPASDFICISKVKKFFYITAYGDITPCCYNPLSFGSLRKEPLAIILKRMWAHHIFRLSSSLECLMNEDALRNEYLDRLINAEHHPLDISDEN